MKEWGHWFEGEGRERARIRILSAGREVVLTIPVEGGAKALKRRDSDPGISGHGKWRREHLGAFETAYSKTPYFIHLMPQIEQVYRLPDGTPLSLFRQALARVANSWLEIEDRREERGDGDNHALRYGEEVATKINLNLSIFDAIFRYGRDTALALMYLRSRNDQNEC